MRIRPAVVADAPLLAWVMLEASRGHVARGAWDVWAGDDEPRTLRLLERLAVQEVPSFCRFDGFLVAEIDGVPAAALSGYDPAAPGMGDPDRAIASAAEHVLSWGPAERAAADQRLAPFMTCITVPPPAVWIVEWVATRPAFRRHGLVHDLLRAVVEVGRRRGFDRSQITLFIGNTAAESAYARAGYGVADQKRHPAFERLLGVPGLVRMVRDI